MAAVAHSEVLAAFLATLEGTPTNKIWPPKIPNGSITVIETGATGKPTVVLRAWVPSAPTP